MPLLGSSSGGGLKPSTPTIGIASIPAITQTASVAFTSSSHGGKGGTVTYVATSSPGGITGSSTTSPITVSGLTNGTAYTFTVVATTSYGVSSDSSSASNSVTPALPTYTAFATYNSTTTFTVPADKSQIAVAIIGAGGVIN